MSDQDFKNQNGKLLNLDNVRDPSSSSFFNSDGSLAIKDVFVMNELQVEVALK